MSYLRKNRKVIGKMKNSWYRTPMAKNPKVKAKEQLAQRSQVSKNRNLLAQKNAPGKNDGLLAQK